MLLILTDKMGYMNSTLSALVIVISCKIFYPEKVLKAILSSDPPFTTLLFINF